MSLFLFAVVIFVLVVVVGGLPFSRQFADQPRILHRMTCIAAGFLITAGLLVALPEGFELFLHSEADLVTSSIASTAFSRPLMAGLAVLAGFLLLLMLEGFGFGHDLHEEHHNHAAEHGHEHLNHPAGHAQNVVIGLSLHSIMDGLVLGAAYSQGELALSLQLALVILMHKFPAAFSLSAYSLHERNNRQQSAIDLLLFAATTPVAMMLSAYFFAQLNEAIIGLMLLFSAGSFIYVATVDVLPDIHIQEKSRETLWLVLSGILSMVLLSVLMTLLLPGAHMHHAH